MPTLILTPRFTPDAQALWRTAGKLGWRVERLASWRIPEELKNCEDPVPYLEGLFGPTFAADLGIQLTEVPDDWLPNLPEEYRKRHVELSTLGKARERTDPAFIKPPNDKSFPAGIYVGNELPAYIPDDQPVLISEVVRWEKEFRCFIVGRQMRSLSVYLRDGELQRDTEFLCTETESAEVRSYLEALLADERIPLPDSSVVDVGVIEGRGWAVIEQNAVWASGIYGCDPEVVLEALLLASKRIG